MNTTTRTPAAALAPATAVLDFMSGRGATVAGPGILPGTVEITYATGGTAYRRPSDLIERTRAIGNGRLPNDANEVQS